MKFTVLRGGENVAWYMCLKTMVLRTLLFFLALALKLFVRNTE